MKIIHFSTVHLRDDSRIRSKMMASLSQRYVGAATLFVQDGNGFERDPAGFDIVDTGPRLSRLSRMALGGWRMTRALLKANPDIAHFHDPELLPWGIVLRLFGVMVIYDVHEDYPEAISQNFRIPWLARKTLPFVVTFVEWICAFILSGIVVVTPQIASRFPAKKTTMIRNWPKLSEFQEPSDRPMRDRPREVGYIGTLTLNRNILGMIDAVEAVKEHCIVLRIAGDFTVESDRIAAHGNPGWANVHFDGWVSREEIAEMLSSIRVGLVVIKPIPHEMLTYPIKLFEYMAAGLPVISSDFPLWREIVETANCGLLVDPLDPHALSQAILWMIENPDEAETMGARGRQAVIENYNWENETEQLFALYERLGFRQ